MQGTQTWAALSCTPTGHAMTFNTAMAAIQCIGFGGSLRGRSSCWGIYSLTVSCSMSHMAAHTHAQESAGADLQAALPLSHFAL